MNCVVARNAKRHAVGDIQPQVRMRGKSQNVVSVKLSTTDIALLTSVIISDVNSFAPLSVFEAISDGSRINLWSRFPMMMKMATRARSWNASIAVGNPGNDRIVLFRFPFPRWAVAFLALHWCNLASLKSGFRTAGVEGAQVLRRFHGRSYAVSFQRGVNRALRSADLFANRARRFIQNNPVLVQKIVGQDFFEFPHTAAHGET